MQPDGVAGNAKNAHRRMKELLEEAKLAEEVGLDVFAVGEHHRPDFVISAPEVVLAAIASVTKKIRLSSAVTVLSSADPVRVFQNFASLDLLSDGRVEIMAGRGSFIESFPLFGYDLKEYNELFTEKLELLLKINDAEKVTWKGKHRASIPNLGVYPRPLQEKLPIWLAVGGTPESAVRAGKLNLPMTVAILGGPPENFVSFTNLFRKSAQQAGHDASLLPLAINTHFFVGENSKETADILYPSYAMMMNRIGRERGWSPLDKGQFEAMRSHGPLTVGSVQEVTDKILSFHKLFQNTRYMAHLMGGDVPHDKVLKAIELFGTKVAPAVRKELVTVN
jgi:probable LLM family oxidoreductase